MGEELDVLFYAHDGRGHGHLSRTIAVALALRRLNPDLRLLLVTGSRVVSDLVGGKLDWIKLPAYESIISAGESKPHGGPSGLAHHSLLMARRGLLADVVTRLRPRCVLVDHLPLGKADELKSALEQTRGWSTRWVLGLRAVPGGQDDPLWSPKSAAAARQSYVRGLWYGDCAVYGPGILASLRRHFPIPIVPTGLVSRAAEVARLETFPPASSPCVGVAGFSWASPTTLRTLAALLLALNSGGLESGRWHIYGAPATELSTSQSPSMTLTFSGFDPSFLPTLRAARLCITYAGYNSITDCLWAKLPVLLVIRDLRETEQSTHAAFIKGLLGSAAVALPELSVTPERFVAAIRQLLSAESPALPGALLAGSETAAHELLDVLAT